MNLNTFANIYKYVSGRHLIKERACRIDKEKVEMKPVVAV